MGLSSHYFFFLIKGEHWISNQKRKLTGKKEKNYFIEPAVLSDLGDNKINKICSLTLAIWENLIIPKYYVLVVKILYFNSNILVK